MVDLESIYRRTLEKCAPEVLVRPFVRRDMPGNVVAIGKSAGALLDGVPFDRAFCAIPRGYREPNTRNTIVARGGHPDIDHDSFRAGEQLLEFVDACDDVLFLISGGGSACVEVPLPPFTREELTEVSARLVASDLSIGAINTVRKHLSAIKGGRLAARVHGRSMTLVYSDVSTGAISDVASGPTVADQTTNADAAGILERFGFHDLAAKLNSETVKHLPNASAELIADNGTLTAMAASLVDDAVLWSGQIEMAVEDAARALADRAESLRPGQVLIAGGEPTVARHGSGKGGRCCELAVRFALLSDKPALFGSSDGIDGSSGIAGISVAASASLTERRARAPVATLEDLLQRSESFAAAELIGRAVIMPPAGNNLRDLFLVAHR